MPLQVILAGHDGVLGRVPFIKSGFDVASVGPVRTSDGQVSHWLEIAVFSRVNH
jgi:hypothetical protein